MESSFVLDTHALLWYLEGNQRLGRQARKFIASPDSNLIVPIIALAESSIIIEHQRTKIPTVNHLLSSLAKDPRFTVFPLTLEIFQRSRAADVGRISELHDRLIVATALFISDGGQDVGLITRDQNLTEFSPVRIIW